jgi:Tfp pilus assembly protein PilV
MTLVEVLVAMLLLTTVVLALGSFTAKFAMATGQARLVIAANEIAAMRLDAIRTQPTYASLDFLADSVTVRRDFTDFAMTTKVLRVGGSPKDSVDYRLVTVLVAHPSLRKIVSKTSAVAAF